ncbi:hypothetical protein [Streptomyces sp. NPDC047028]|uniref:hypothetical protein n=1 Tax=Streptomyces sp. NPDC047028 TaxID=3155793 RepID=UPI0033E2B39C
MAIMTGAGVSASTPAVQEACNTEAAFNALVAEHGLQVEEWDTSTLDENLRDKFVAFYIETRDRKVIVVPAGQDPAHRLAAVRALLVHPGVIA